MRIFRGLENIHAVIDRHEAEWRKEQGEEPERPAPISLEEAVRRRLTAQPDAGSGRFSADRFLGGNTEPVKREEPVKNEPEPLPSPEPALEPEPEPSYDVPEPETSPEPASAKHHSWLYNEVMKAVNDAASGDRKNTKVVAVFVPVLQEGREIPKDVDEVPADEGENVRAIEIIRNKDGRHSRLYDEVMRAVNDAAEDGKAGKIVAVFVPVVQNGDEFGELPADETVTLSPVSEDAVKIEAVPAPVPVPEPEAEAVPEPEPELEPEAMPEEPEQELLSEPEPEAGSGDFDLIPEGQEEPDAELAGAFREMEEKLDEDLQEEYEHEQEQDYVSEEAAPDEPAEELAEITEAAEEEPELEPETEEAAEPEEEPESEVLSEPETMPELEAMPETELEVAEEDEHQPDIIPEETEQSLELEAEPEVPDVPEEDTMSDFGQEEDEVIAAGEPLQFEDINSDTVPEDVVLPEELEDDEVFEGAEFDETLTELHKPDEEDEETIILEEPEELEEEDDEEDEEIELLPDPV